MKKTQIVKTVGLVILGLTVAVPQVFGAVVQNPPTDGVGVTTTLNGDSQDRPTLRVGNYTQFPNSNDWYQSINNVNAGDVVSFVFYYHNTGSVTARNTKARISLSVNDTSISASGSISADNAPSVYGSASAQVTSGQKFTGATFQSALWYPNQDYQNPDPLPFGQNGSTITSSGVNVGDIAPGWATQGWLVVRFKTEGTTQPQGNPPIVQTLPADTITETSAALHGTVNPNGGEHTTLWFEYGKTQSLGQSTAVKTMYPGQGTLNVAEFLYTLEKGTTYYFRIVAQNEFGTSRGSILSFMTKGGSTGSAPSVTTHAATNINQTSATLNGEVNPNGASGYYWFEYGTTQSLGQTTSAQTFGAQTTPLSISFPLSGLSQNTTYYFRVVAQNSYGTSNGSILSFTTSGQTGNAPGVQTTAASNITQTSATLNGQVNPNGLSTSYWFEYGTTQSLGQSTGLHSIGSGTSFQPQTFSLTNLSQNTTYYFRIAAQNSYGTSRGSILSFTTSGQTGGTPFAQTYAASNISQTSATLNGQVNPNDANTSYWFEYGTTQSLGQTTGMQNAGAGSSWVNASAQISGLSENTTYYFRVAAQNSYGTTRGSILSFTTNSGGVTPGSAPTVQTLPATGISQTSAVLNGSVNPNNASSYYWFEYGTTQSLGQTTAAQTLGAGSSAQNIAGYISNLSQNTTYYFRAVAQNNYGTSRGSILSFTTNSGGVTPGGAPTVLTNPASGVYETSATLNGQVNPNGANTSYWFEYGTNQSLGRTTNMQNAGTGTALISIASSVSGLAQNTTYYFRAVAQNSYGTSYGSILSFVTNGGGGTNHEAPYVQTYNATNVDQYSATLRGSVDPNGSATSYWFEYGRYYSLGQSTNMQSLGSGDYANDVSRYISGLVPDETYYYRVVAQNAYGTSYGSIMSFVTDNNGYNTGLYVQTDSATGVGRNSATLNGRVESNYGYQNNYQYQYVYAWFEYGVNYNSLSMSTSQQSMGAYSSSDFSRSVSGLSSGTTYYYRAAARTNNGNTAYGQTRSFTTTGSGGYSQQPYVVTDPATIVTQNSALLNGRVNPNNGVTTAWFEYGPTTALGLSTIHQPMGAGNTLTNIASAISGLVPNTTYYFRAVGQNQNGTAYGSILSFQTSGSIVVPPVTPVNPQPPIIIRTGEGLSCVILVPALNVSALHAGEEFTYTVTYRNGCSYPLNNAFLKVILPTETEFISTNYPFFNIDANGISYSLGAIPSGFQSAISIQGRVINSARQGDTLIFSSVLNFNDANDRFQSVSAYLTAVVASGKTLTATVLDAFSNLFGNWLFDLLLILLILFLVWWIFFRKDEEEEQVDVLRDDAVSARPYGK